MFQGVTFAPDSACVIAGSKKYCQGLYSMANIKWAPSSKRQYPFSAFACRSIVSATNRLMINNHSWRSGSGLLRKDASAVLCFEKLHFLFMRKRNDEWCHLWRIWYCHDLKLTVWLVILSFFQILTIVAPPWYFGLEYLNVFGGKGIF